MLEPYGFDKDDEVLDLLHSVFNPWCGNKDYFLWKYKSLKCDVTSFPLAWVLKKDDQIVAFNGYFPRKIKVGTKWVVCVQSMDTATHNSFRGKGLFRILQDGIYKEMSKHGVAWVYGWGNENSFRLLISKVGWNIWDEQSMMLRILDGKKFLEAKLKNTMMVLCGGLVLKLYSQKWRTPRVRNGTVVEPLSFPKEIDELLIDVHDSFDFIAERSASYLTWRVSNPIDGLRPICIYVEDRITGYAILQKDDAENLFEIIDLLGLNNDAVHGLLAYVEDLARAEKISMIRFRVNIHHPYDKYFRQSGYFRSRTRFKCVGKSINANNLNAKIDFGNQIKRHWTLLERNE